jgi:hypothetical protein
LHVFIESPLRGVDESVWVFQGSVCHASGFFAAHHKGLHFDGDPHDVDDKNPDVFLIFRCLKFSSEHVFLGDQN